jgi:hypothetical protein
MVESKFSRNVHLAPYPTAAGVPAAVGTTRNHLICDEFPVMISDIVIGSLLWVQAQKTMTFFKYRHSLAKKL